MERTLAERLARAFVASWETYDTDALAGMLDPACILIESDGQTFRGVGSILDELNKRLAGVYGPWRSSRWEITTLSVAEETCVFEWVVEGRRSCDGVTIMRYREGKICFVREYCTMGSLWEANLA